ncbi:MAG: hypothetical protein K5891_06565 [Lachnospiraceae bacterium]|nr:hypothetical protein [Lachnospiraceae bacterium]
MEQITEEHDLWKPRTDKKVFYFQPQTLKGIKAGIREGLKRDKERKSEQVIALRHQTFLPGDYSICDMEAAIPKGDLKGTTRGEGKQAEIDLIAICPEKKSILLIEYKCQDKAVTGGLEDSLKGWNVRPKNSKGEETAEKKNVAAHFKDYLAALEACGNQDFVRVLIREYNYLAALRNGEPIKAADGSEELPSEELQEYARNIRILFLFTNSPKVGVRWSDNLTENSYRLARKSLIGCRDMYRKELKKCGLDESFLANAEKAICLAAEGPENVILREELFTSVEDLKFPSDSVVRK